MNIKVVMASVRSVRAGKAVTDWVMKNVAERETADKYEVLDLKELNLPWYDEAFPPMSGQAPANESTKNWSRIVSETDAFIFVTPEYNHGYSPALKNAIDYLFTEWKDKLVAFVGYGGNGAAFAIEQLRQVVEFVGMKPVGEAVGVNTIWEAVDENGKLKEEYVSGDISKLLDTVENELKVTV